MPKKRGVGYERSGAIVPNGTAPLRTAFDPDVSSITKHRRINVLIRGADGYTCGPRSSQLCHFPSWCTETNMKKAKFDRRLSRRLNFKTPLRVRVWKSTAPEQRAESLNLSRNGVFFATDLPIQEGEALEILLKMPEEITAEPTTEWRCTGHVVRVEPVDSSRGKLGVGVQFDCYEVSRAVIPQQESAPYAAG